MTTAQKLFLGLLAVLFVAYRKSASLVLRPRRRHAALSFARSSHPVQKTFRRSLPSTPGACVGLSTANSDVQETISRRLMDWFQGDFDNYQQVVEDRKQNLQPREGGGHEHFHCTLVPLSSSSRLAAFYFDANPTRIFRFRHYQLNFDAPSASSHNNDNVVVEMQLSTLHPDLESLLRSHSSDPLSWPSLFEQFRPDNNGTGSTSHHYKIEMLPNCEIAWSLQRDPVQHAYTQNIPESESTDISTGSLHAVMVHGEAIVNSTIVPGMAIRILDQLSLYPDVFYINDRGFDPLTGAYIYGNQRGVPYRLCRVSTFDASTNDGTKKDGNTLLRREVYDSDIAWTLGPAWRTEKEYEANMAAIGGVSAGINKSSYKSKMTKVENESG